MYILCINLDAITYKVKVTLKGNYSGTKTVTFKILPRGTSVSTIGRGNKALTVRWKKQATKMPKARIAGYQVQYCLRKDFKKGAKTVAIKGYKKTSRKISGLKAKKRYYVRVRTYYKTGGKTYYSGWSAVKSALTK